jgi:hypothetical protein
VELLRYNSAKYTQVQTYDARQTIASEEHPGGDLCKALCLAPRQETRGSNPIRVSWDGTTRCVQAFPRMTQGMTASRPLVKDSPRIGCIISGFQLQRLERSKNSSLRNPSRDPFQLQGMSGLQPDLRGGFWNKT